MAQTIKIAGATYPDVPAVQLATPTSTAWFFDAQVLIDADGDTGIANAALTWELDGNGDIMPLPEGSLDYHGLFELDSSGDLEPIQ